MAFMSHKKIKGYTYYYAEEREWREGKSQRKWQKYLGPLERIIQAVEKGGGAPAYAILFELGAPGAYLSIAHEIDTVGIINSLVPKRNQGISIGEYILFAAINRGVDAVSKRSMWHWFQDTILLHCFPRTTKDSLCSQRFWDNMNLIREERIPVIWRAILDKVLSVYSIDFSLISYDGTNFYTFICTFNTRCTIAKRGKNKQGRGNLRQVNYALFCAKEDHIPLYFDVYEGNMNDSKAFFTMIENFKNAFHGKIAEGATVTIVFDKGNNSPENIQKIDQSAFHFVGALKPSEHRDLASISHTDPCMKPLSRPDLEGVTAYRTEKKIYDRTRTVIVTFNPELYADQLKTVNNDIKKCIQKLSLLQQKLLDRAHGLIKKGKKPTMDSVKKQVRDILKRQYMKDLIPVEYEERNDIPLVSYALNTDAFAQIADTYLGKTILFTDNHEWPPEDIILAYRSQYIIENAFKEMKHRKLGCWWPLYHWTDQKIKVHGLYCSLTLLLRSLMSRKARLANLPLSMERMHKKLMGIKEVVNVYPKQRGKGVRKRPKNYTITKMDEIQKRLFDLFKLNEYTQS